MNRLILISITILTLFLYGCHTSDHSDSTVIGTGVRISFVNTQGEDLLDPENPNAITEDNTDLYYLIDGKKEKQFRGHLDSPKMFSISDEKLSNRYSMGVTPNTIRNEDTATTYLKFKDGSLDTIKVAYDYFNGNSVAVYKVWYNGKVRFDVDSDQNNEENMEHVEIYFVITKDFE